VSKSDLIKAVCYGDSHYPFQSDSALEIVKKIVVASKPDMLIHMGDLVDCYELSDYERDPDRFGTLQADIDAGAAHLAEMAALAPKARHVLLGGNHETRLRRAIWNQPERTQSIFKLGGVRKVLNWPTLLSLDKSGWDFYDYGDQTHQMLLPKMIVKHGHVVRKWSAMSARGEWEKYGHSGASGHVHRLGQFFHAKHGGGCHMWVETGCTCDLNPDYTPDPNWQQGLVVLTVQRGTGAFQCETVYIRNGLAIYRDREYRA
jgi:Calcineurin-like phosphoesterase